MSLMQRRQREDRFGEFRKQINRGGINRVHRVRPARINCWTSFPAATWRCASKMAASGMTFIATRTVRSPVEDEWQFFP